ncbi:hypothetical protein D779_0493 [Imhoffiella purpurea]|uniref:Uncharacterized protein n=1 Tax=Imhoffiella purpurea TaxID=1249627 RepID=W9V9A3_9GAMM|nr:hypothetical protein D779_0493 [Imhoffiella purpurea]
MMSVHSESALSRWWRLTVECLGYAGRALITTPIIPQTVRIADPTRARSGRVRCADHRRFVGLMIGACVSHTLAGAME